MTGLSTKNETADDFENIKHTTLHLGRENNKTLII